MRSKRRLSVAKMFPLIVLGYLGMQVYAVFRAYTGLALAPASIPWLAAFDSLRPRLLNYQRNY